MLASEATVGARVRTRMRWPGVPEGSEGMIVQAYEGGYLIAWDLADRPLPDVPPELMTFENMPAISIG